MSGSAPGGIKNKSNKSPYPKKNDPFSPETPPRTGTRSGFGVARSGNRGVLTSYINGDRKLFSTSKKQLGHARHQVGSKKVKKITAVGEFFFDPFFTPNPASHPERGPVRGSGWLVRGSGWPFGVDLAPRGGVNSGPRTCFGALDQTLVRIQKNTTFRAEVE